MCRGENLPGVALADGGDTRGCRYLLEGVIAASLLPPEALGENHKSLWIGWRWNSGAIYFLKASPRSPGGVSLLMVVWW